MNAITKHTSRVSKLQRSKQEAKKFVFEPTKNVVSNAMLLSVHGVEPTVGMGATLCYFKDRHAATIVEVTEYKNVSMIRVQEDVAKRTDKNGASFDQHYDYQPNPNGRAYTYRFKNGRWVGAQINENGRIVTARNFPALVIGVRDQFYDFSAR